MGPAPLAFRREPVPGTVRGRRLRGPVEPPIDSAPAQRAAQPIVVLFVDDEQALANLFVKRFENTFVVYTASNGQDGLDMMRRHPEIDVVVTDIRMPVMTGLEFVRQAKQSGTDASFIVVSGHADAGDVIEALRGGARNFLQKPYSLAELEQSIRNEVRQLREFRAHQVAEARERALDSCLVSVQRLAYRIPNDLSWVSPLAFRLVGLLGPEFAQRPDLKLNVALGLMEIVTNAIEHGNLGVGGKEKIELKSKGERLYRAELERRAALEPYRSRHVLILCSVDSEKAVFDISDEGTGFDVNALPDPTNPENLFSPSGRGILLTRAFLDEVQFSRRGNSVTLIKYRARPPS
jgi:CheY-like chemotaxis protein